MLQLVNRKLGLVIGIFSIIFLILSYQLPAYTYAIVDADMIPKGLGWLLLLLSILLFFQRDNETEEQKKRRQLPKSEVKVLVVVALLIFLYIFLLEILGFIIVTMLFIFFCSRYLGYESLRTNIIVSIVFPLVLYTIFVYLLQISLPQGILPI